MPDLTKIEIAPNYFLEAPGLQGDVQRITPSLAATRSGSNPYRTIFLQAQEEAGIRTVLTFEMKVTNVRPLPTWGSTRSGSPPIVTRQGEPAIKLRGPRLNPQMGYAVLYADESGISQWILPEDVPSAGDQNEPVQTREVKFHLPRKNAFQISDDTASTPMRGPITKFGRRMVHILAWSTQDFIGNNLLHLATLWSKIKTPYGFCSPSNTAFQNQVDWASLGQGRALLLLHGTFSTSEATFNTLIHNAHFQELAHRRYEQRIFGFNHPSLPHSPIENGLAFFENLPPGISLDIDILTHSRGGLVARELAERSAELNRQGFDIKINRVVLVACPNRGTILADGSHWIDWIDRYTNLLTELPDNQYLFCMEGVLMALKLVAYGGLKALPGLSCLVPDGKYLTRLNKGSFHSTQYYALSAKFMPQDPNVVIRFGKDMAHKVLNTIFTEDNDGIVPTRGAFEAGTATPGFPIPENRYQVFELEGQIHHCNYFAHDVVNQHIKDWLVPE